MDNMGRGEPEFGSYLYFGGGRNPISIPASFSRILRFMERLHTPVLVDSPDEIESAFHLLTN